MPARTRRSQDDLTKLALISTFLSGFLAFVAYPPVRRRHQRALDLQPMDLGLLVASTFRLGRMVAYDKVAEPLRAPVAVTKRDKTGAGETTAPRGQGTRRALGELLTCPICAGTWIAAGLVYALHFFPGATRVFMTIMSTIGLAEVLDALTESWNWSGQAARKEAGRG